jgi:hypothetical protein
MPGDAFYNLGGNIVGRATHGPFLLLQIFQLGGQSKIPDLNFHILIQEDIAHFQISVNDLVGVHIF